MDEEKARSRTDDDPIRIVLAVLIALSAITGALFTWRAALAGGSDDAGLAALANAEQARNVSQTQVYQHLQGYVQYLANRVLGTGIAADQQRLNGEIRDAYYSEQITDSAMLSELSLLSDTLAQRAQEATDKAGIAQYFLIPDYLQQDGTYNAARESGETETEASRYHDVDSAAHFAKSDHLRTKTTNLLLVLLGLAVAVWCFVLAQALKKPRQYVPMGVGVAVLLICASTGAWVELFT